MTFAKWDSSPLTVRSLLTPLLRLRRGLLRGVALVAILTVIAAFSAISDRAVADTPKGPRTELNRVALDNFDPDTWKPTQDSPLPPMESPIRFKAKDDAAYWFDHENRDLEKVTHSRSLGASAGPTTVKVNIGEPDTEAAHTVSFIVWPDGAKNMPFTQPGGVTGEVSVDLITSGLYAWQCIIHPYMFGAVVVDDPATPGADFGMKLKWIDGTVINSGAWEVLKTVHSFFIITQPRNWQIYHADKEVEWAPNYPRAPILVGDADGQPHLIPNLHEEFRKMFGEPKKLSPPKPPSEPGVGTVYYGSQWEMSAGKTKPGSITVFDTETWKMTNKWFVPSVNLNNPHNFWTSNNGEIFYSTNWFANNLTVLKRSTGEVIRELVIGPSPSHVVTRSFNENPVIPNNGGGRVSEVEAGGTRVVANYQTQARGEKPAFPHGHWVTGDGKYVVTPNSNETQASIIDMSIPDMMKPETGHHPVAASTDNAGTRAFVANLFSHTITCVSIKQPACKTPDGKTEAVYQIDLRQNFDKVTGKSTGPFALAPIQLPVSPDDNAIVTVGTVTGNIVIIDPKTNKFVKTLPCGPGCHGANWGAKKGGGYYAYVTTKFMNKMIVVNADPNGDGDLSDAAIVGELLTNAGPGVQMDDRPKAHEGQGGNGIFIYPIVYDGWVQRMPDAEKAKLTCKQREPLKAAVC
jgi:plastocyanin